MTRLRPRPNAAFLFGSALYFFPVSQDQAAAASRLLRLSQKMLMYRVTLRVAGCVGSYLASGLSRSIVSIGGIEDPMSEYKESKDKSTWTYHGNRVTPCGQGA